MKTVKALVGDKVLKSERCCGESGTLGVTRPDMSTQVRFRKEEEIRKGEALLRASGAVGEKDNVKILTSCPSCLQGLALPGRLAKRPARSRLHRDRNGPQILGENWLPEYVHRANQGGIERVLV
jgi:Fe-S oxidoreductase